MVLTRIPINTQWNQTDYAKRRYFELVEHLEWWDDSRNPRKWDSKTTSIAAIVETKAEEDLAEKSSTLIGAAENGVRF